MSVPKGKVQNRSGFLFLKRQTRAASYCWERKESNNDGETPNYIYMIPPHPLSCLTLNFTTPSPHSHCFYCIALVYSPKPVVHLPLSLGFYPLVEAQSSSACLFSRPPGVSFQVCFRKTTVTPRGLPEGELHIDFPVQISHEVMSALS